VRTLLLLVLAAGCAPPDDPTPGRQHLTIDSQSYTLAPQSERYVCYTMTAEADAAVDEVVVHNGSRTHHMAIFSTLAPEPDGFSECPSQIKQSWIPLYGGGQGTAGVKLPAGAAFKFDRGTQILMQLHLVNASNTEVTERTSADLMLSPADPATLLPAGIFAVGNMTFQIPPTATNYPVVGKCSAPKALDVFALFPHMHRLGRSITFEHGATEATAQQIYGVDPWSFGDQPMMLKTLKVQQGDFMRATCTYDNTDGKVIEYGESTADEMCFVVLFYTPFDRLGACLD